jgi:hypothetical protein
MKKKHKDSYFSIQLMTLSNDRKLTIMVSEVLQGLESKIILNTETIIFDFATDYTKNENYEDFKDLLNNIAKLGDAFRTLLYQ